MSDPSTPSEPLPPEEDPTSHRTLGSWLLVGVVVLVLAGAVQTARVAGTMRPPPPPALVASRDLVEGAMRHHFRGPPGVRKAGLPKQDDG